MKTTVTEHALMLRVNRKLAADGQKLRRCREDQKDFSELGRYYIVGEHSVEAMHIDLEELAREVGALKPFEHLQD